jgi:hypothetical protein
MVKEGKHLPPNSEDTPPKRSTRKNKRQIALDREISRMTKANRLEYQDVMRRLFREVFGVKADKHFISHESASEEEVKAYAEGMGDGPDANDLHFHMEHGPENVWNKRVLQLLLQRLNQLIEDEEEALRGPTPSDAYWMFIFENKYSNVRRDWRAGGRRMTSDGKLETSSQTVDRVEEMYDNRDDKARKGQRRHTVSITKCPLYLY